MKLKHEIDYKGLENYIKSLNLSEIETNWIKPENPKLIKGHSIEEIEYFKTDKSKIPLEKVIKYGEPFIVDALGNDLSIVILSKRGYKFPTGRVIHAKFITTIIEDCRSLFGTTINGYWIIPSQFIKLILNKN